MSFADFFKRGSRKKSQEKKKSTNEAPKLISEYGQCSVSEEKASIENIATENGKKQKEIAANPQLVVDSEASISQEKSIEVPALNNVGILQTSEQQYTANLATECDIKEENTSNLECTVKEMHKSSDYENIQLSEHQDTLKLTESGIANDNIQEKSVKDLTEIATEMNADIPDKSKTEDNVKQSKEYFTENEKDNIKESHCMQNDTHVNIEKKEENKFKEIGNVIPVPIATNKEMKNKEQFADSNLEDHASSKCESQYKANELELNGEILKNVDIELNKDEKSLTGNNNEAFIILQDDSESISLTKTTEQNSASDNGDKISLNTDDCYINHTTENLKEQLILNDAKNTLNYILDELEKQQSEVKQVSKINEEQMNKEERNEESNDKNADPSIYSEISERIVSEAITEIKQQSEVQQVSKINEEQVNKKETNEESNTKNADPSIYSEISERIVSEAITEAIEETNLIMFDEEELKINNEEPISRKTSLSKQDSANGSEQDSGSILTDNEDVIGDVFPEPSFNESPTGTQNWKVGYLHVKLPHKKREKAHLKAWQKRWIVIQADEFTADADKNNRYLMLSVYQSESGNSRRHSASFWKSLCSKKTVIYRSLSKTHPYTFTVAIGSEPLLHLASHSETESQEWMSAIRNILWPPNPMIQLEKVLNGNEFDVSFIDNDFSCRAGLLGTYGCMTVTNRKLILTHPQSGYVIQEWYLNTVDKFHIVPQLKEGDMNKVLSMHTSSDSSTGRGELRLFCNEAAEFLKSLASTIHKVLQYYCKGNEKKYKKELDELAEWLTPQPSPTDIKDVEVEEYYKVPKRQIKSLLDIPNFIFNKPVDNLVSSKETIMSTNTSMTNSPILASSRTSISMLSQDSGFSTAASSSDFINCSQTSFSIGEAMIRRPGRVSSSSESSDTYSPPVSPLIPTKIREKDVGKLKETN